MRRRQAVAEDDDAVSEVLLWMSPAASLGRRVNAFAIHPVDVKITLEGTRASALQRQRFDASR